MSIQTPTSEGASPIDVAVLTRLAGELFSALPGQAPDLSSARGGVPFAGEPSPTAASSGTLPAAPGVNLVPQSSQSVLALAASVPSLVPHAAAQNSLPEHAASVPPGLDGRIGGVSLGVPQAYAPALPTVPGISSDRAGTPDASYYFLGEGLGYPSVLQSFEVQREDRVSAQSFGLPGAEDLNALLRDNPRLNVQGVAAPAAPSTSDVSSPYYFVTQESQTGREHVPVHGAAGTGTTPLDVYAIRRDFPALQERVNGRQLVWFDNAATTHKPQSVIDRISYFYAHENSNIHRAAHELAARATDAYEAAREKVRGFIGAASVDEIVFVRGTTEAINLVAKTWGWQNVGEGDEIIVSHLEHHANIVPWQQLAAAKGAKLRVIPVDDTGQVLLDEYRKLLNPRTKIVAATVVSNALGTVTPIREIVAMAHAMGVVTLVDGAQSVSHMRTNVQEIGADFFVFSGHKVFGPTGIGVVYGRRALLEHMPPWQGGGNMIADVTFERTLFNPPPNKFEAGTGNIADAVGLGAAIDYVEKIGIDKIARYEHDLLAYATHLLQPIPGVRLIGTAQHKASVLSFVLKGYGTEEVGKALNQEGIAVRSGHHCAQPILRRFGVEATVRPSLAFYNTCEEVDRFINVIRGLSKSRN